jgi:hypothetical protein
MGMGQAEGGRMRGQVGQAYRGGFLDQQAEDAVAGGPMADRGDLLLGHAHGDEPGQPVALPDHPEGAVSRVDQGRGRLHDPPQDGLELEITLDRDDRLQQRVHPVTGHQHRREPRLQLGEQIIQPQLRQHHTGAVLPGLPVRGHGTCLRS